MTPLSFREFVGFFVAARPHELWGTIAVAVGLSLLTVAAGLALLAVAVGLALLAIAVGVLVALLEIAVRF